MTENFPIQIGLDIATSLSIIGASVAYVVSERRRRNAESNWRNDDLRRRRLETSYSIVDDILKFLPVITATGVAIHAELNKTLDAGSGVFASEERLAQYIRQEYEALKTRMEFELLRPLEVRVDFVQGAEVWDQHVPNLHERISQLDQAFAGLVNVCRDSAFSRAQKAELLMQALPLFLSDKTIGNIHSIYTLLLDFATQVKEGLLKQEVEGRERIAAGSAGQ